MNKSVFSILLIFCFSKQSFTMQIYEKEILGNVCIHNENPPLESVFYKLDTKETLVLPKGQYLITANVNFIANVISKKVQDEAILLIGFYVGDNPKNQIKINDEGILHKGIGKYFTAGSYGWTGGIMTLEKIFKFKNKTKINVYLGLKKVLQEIRNMKLFV